MSLTCAKYGKMSGVVFCPWIGSKYREKNRFGIKVLVLGESHYADRSETRPTFTEEVIREKAQTKRYAFFTKIAKVLLGLDRNTWLDNKTRADVWEHVAFYNYIQGFVSKLPRVRPSPDMWEAAKSPFLEVVRELRPQLILILGKELYYKLPPLPKDIEVCSVQHPSFTGFSYSKWNPLFAEAIERVKGPPACLKTSTFLRSETPA